MGSGKVAVVTGASSGIGRAIAEMLLQNGLHVLASGRTSGQKFTESAELKVSTLDMLDSTTPQELLQTAITCWGRVDYLFVNAGTIESGKIEEIDIEKMCLMLRLKVESSFRLIYTFLKQFKANDTGHIFITSSVLGTKTRENSGAYAACNFALEALAESLRMELSNSNVKITCIEPGLVQTNLHSDWPVHPKELLDISGTLLPEDIAEVVKEIMNKPDHIRVPRYMILPRGHKI